jgi:hypothetical protein
MTATILSILLSPAKVTPENIILEIKTVIICNLMLAVKRF